MLQLGVIGTNWITRQFIEAVQTTHTFNLLAIYSRTVEHAQNLANQLAKPQVEITTDLTDFFNNPRLDVVYIASPNSLHYHYICQAIRAHKQVIVEKPLVSTRREFLKIQELLTQYPDVFVLEAARHIHENEFKLLQKQVHNLPQKIGRASCRERV